MELCRCTAFIALSTAFRADLALLYPGRGAGRRAKVFHGWERHPRALPSIEAVGTGQDGGRRWLPGSRHLCGYSSFLMTRVMLS